MAKEAEKKEKKAVKTAKPATKKVAAKKAPAKKAPAKKEKPAAKKPTKKVSKPKEAVEDIDGEDAVESLDSIKKRLLKKAKADGTYAEKKSMCSEKILNHLYKFIPELKGHVEVTDYSTPLTYERYCSSWEGSWMSAWYKKKPSFSHPLKSQKIKGLYFEGHRTKMPGGLPITLSSARIASQLICRDFGHRWLEKN